MLHQEILKTKNFSYDENEPNYSEDYSAYISYIDYDKREITSHLISRWNSEYDVINTMKF